MWFRCHEVRGAAQPAAGVRLPLLRVIELVQLPDSSPDSGRDRSERSASLGGSSAGSDAPWVHRAAEMDLWVQHWRRTAELEGMASEGGAGDGAAGEGKTRADRKVEGGKHGATGGGRLGVGPTGAAADGGLYTATIHSGS